MRGRGFKKGTQSRGTSSSGRSGKRRRAKDREEEEVILPDRGAAATTTEDTTPSPKKSKGSFLKKCNPIGKIFRDLDNSFNEQAEQLAKATQAVNAYKARIEEERQLEREWSEERANEQTKKAEPGKGRSERGSSSPPLVVPAAAAAAAEEDDWVSMIDDETSQGGISPDLQDDPLGPTTLERLSALQRRYDQGESLGDRELTGCLLSTLATLAAREAKVAKLTEEVNEMRQQFKNMMGEMLLLKEEVKLLKKEKEKAEIRTAEKELLGKNIPSDFDLQKLKGKLSSGMGLSPGEIPEMVRMGISAEQADRLKAKGIIPTKTIKMTWTDVTLKHGFLSKLRNLPNEFKPFRFEMSLPPCRREKGRELLQESYQLRKKYGCRTQLRYDKEYELYIAVKLPSERVYSRLDPARMNSTPTNP